MLIAQRLYFVGEILALSLTKFYGLCQGACSDTCKRCLQNHFTRCFLISYGRIGGGRYRTGRDSPRSWQHRANGRTDCYSLTDLFQI